MAFPDRLIAVLFALALPLAAGAEDFSASYFAPLNSQIFKAVFPDGTAREFERDISATGFRLRSVGGWSGSVSGDANVVISGPGKDGGVETWRYERGRVVGYSGSEGNRSCAYSKPRSAPPCPYEPLAIVEYENARDEAEEYSRREMSGKWSGTGRLAFPYINPNQSGCLYCELALLSLLFVLCDDRKLRSAGVLMFAVFAALTLLTGSRGSLLGLLLGVTVFGSSRFRELAGSRVFWITAAVGLIVLGGYLYWHGAGQMTRGFTARGGLDWSNALRVDMWKAAPRMMVDAPGGWGFCGAGRAFMSWYMPTSVVCLPGSLMNDHLTLMAECGWVVRWLYLFALSAVLAAGVWLVLRRREPLMLAVVSAFLAMAWFNPVYGEWGLWVVPLISLLALGRIRLRRRIQALSSSVAVCAGLASSACAGIYVYGRSSERNADEVPVRAVAGRVMVNGDDPRIWVVDDGRGTLGGIFVAKDLRDFYTEVKSAPAMGLVTDIADLPAVGVDRLVLAGKAANDWLLRLSEDEAARRHLPKSVVFLSPPFNPSEVPSAVVALCHPQLVVGEFAAKFRGEYGKTLPDWVMVVPGLEKYMMGWPELAAGGR